MGILKKIGILAAIAGIILPLMGCGDSTPTDKTDYASTINIPEKPTKGYIWEATKNGKNIHLVGTMHPAPANVDYFNDTLNKIIDEADVLGVEIDLTDKATVDKANSLLMDSYISKEGTVKERLSDEDFKKFEKLLDVMGISYGTIKDYSDTGVTSILSSTGFIKIGFGGEVADVSLTNKFKELNKEVISLETPELQANVLEKTYSYLDLSKSLSQINPETYLADGSKTINTIFDAYVNSDKKFAEDHMKKQKTELPQEVYTMLHTNRNTAMVEKINEYMKEDKKYVIAVGYMHFFGEDSVLKLLEAQGYTITDLVK